MPILNEFTYSSCDRKNSIYVREWLPESAPAGVVLLAHGIAEHISRYDDFARFLAENGFVAAGMDHLGHGKSVSAPEHQGYFGEFGGWELVVGDMRKLYERMREQYFSLPVFMLGHSMGSFLTRTYIIRYHDGPDGAILVGTGQYSGVQLNAGLALANRIIKSKGASQKSKLLKDMAFFGYNARIKPVRTEFDWLSRDEAVVDAYLADPDCGFIPSAGLFRDMFTGIKYISSMKNLDRIKTTLPVYFLAGDADPVGDYGKGVVKAYNSFLKAGLADVSLKLYHGARHEILSEPNKAEVYADILAWLRAKCLARKQALTAAERQ